MLRCTVDMSIPEENKCAWCCIYCEKKDKCAYRCDGVDKWKTEDKIEEHCKYVC